MASAMPYQLFQYPVPGPADLADLNAYVAAHRVVSVNQHLVQSTGGATLVFVVQTLGAAMRTGGGGGKKIDYREELSAEDFAIFSRLRDERKKIAEAEGVPVYAVFTNEQLAEMVKRKASTLSEMGSIEGIGKARLEKHGGRLLATLGERVTHSVT